MQVQIYEQKMNDWYKKQHCHVTFLREMEKEKKNQICHRRGYSIHYKRYVCNIIMIYNKWKINPEIILNLSNIKL